MGLAVLPLFILACGGDTQKKVGNDGGSNAVRDGGQALDGPARDPGADATTENDARADAPTPTLDGGRAPDAAMADAGAVNDAAPSFLPQSLAGKVWLFGWSGGLDHYSWVRFFPNSGGTNGTWTVRNATCGSCTPYIPCEGNDGLFIASTTSVTLQYPTTCGGGAPGSQTLVFKSTQPVSGPPQGADLQVVFAVEDTGSIVGAFRYPDTRCGADLAGCGDPFP